MTISVNEDALSEVAEGVSLQISEVRVGADAAAAMGGSAAVAAGDVDVGSVTPLVASADAASFMISSNAKLDAVAVSDGGVAVSEGGIRTFTIALTSAPAERRGCRGELHARRECDVGSGCEQWRLRRERRRQREQRAERFECRRGSAEQRRDERRCDDRVNEDALSEVAEGVSLQISEVRVGADAAAAIGQNAAVEPATWMRERDAAGSER